MDSSDDRAARVEAGLLPAAYIEGTEPEPMRLADRMEHYGVPAAGIAVIDDGELVWARGYGVREVETALPADEQTLFQAASISKPVAAAAALLIVAAGDLELDTDVNRKLTSWQVPDHEFAASKPVTLRGLLSHSAGLTVHGFPGYAAGAPVPTLIQVLDGAPPANTGPIRVDIEPGTRYRYSGGGYTVAQQLMIDVAGEPFPVLLDRLVLKPAGMTNSTYEQPLPTSLENRAAVGYHSAGHAVEGRCPEMAAAGLWTTSSDLARFAIAIRDSYNGKEGALLDAATVRAILTPQHDNYGFGLAINGEGESLRFGHSGSNVGYRCRFVMYLGSGDGAAVMTSSDSGALLVPEILAAVAAEYGWTDFAPEARPAIQLDEAQLDAYAGRYRFSPEFVVSVRASDGHLVVELPGEPRFDFHARSETEFFALEDAPDIEFVRDANGVITEMRAAGNAGRKIE